MDSTAIAFAKLAGVLKGAQGLLELQIHRPGHGPRALYLNFSPGDAKRYFEAAAKSLAELRKLLPYLYEDFPDIAVVGTVAMAPPITEMKFSRHQVESLILAINQIFEIRAHTELATPIASEKRRVFITHGSSNVWLEVQAYIERDIEVATLELAQQPNLGRHVLLKLKEESDRCDSAVIVMTGDDVNAEGEVQARQNVMHEIGYFQAKFGLSRVCLLHEDGVSIPSNIHGLVYIPFTKGIVSMAYGLLHRELKAFYAL